VCARTDLNIRVLIDVKLAALATTVSASLPAVATVSVNCTDQPFNLGGSITGLTGGGLVLGNGTDTRTVAAGATGFTMPVRVAYGVSFAVLVMAQPSGLTCSNGGGTVANSDVSSVHVDCGAPVVNFSTVGAATWTVPTG
jgi:hypothetical protein